MGDALLVKDLLNYAENVKSVVTKCENENLLMLETLCNATKATKSYQLLDTCGDGSDSSVNKKSDKANLIAKISLKEHLSTMIKNATKENSTLRESNVKLKQESKIQDMKIRELNRKVMIHEKNKHLNESQKALIRDLKNSADDKTAEIMRLKKSIENVRVLLSKEQNKKKLFFQEHERISRKSKIANLDLKSKVETLLEQIDVLLKEGEQSNDGACLGDKSFSEKISKTLKKLMVHLENDKHGIHGNLDDSTTNNCTQTSETHNTKRDIGVQTFDGSDLIDS